MRFTFSGLGSVIGFIKVGKKRLFLLDHYGNQNELYPLCVLDFYVHESQQRKGCGLKLFSHMLEVCIVSYVGDTLVLQIVSFFACVDVLCQRASTDFYSFLH